MIVHGLSGRPGCVHAVSGWRSKSNKSQLVIDDCSRFSVRYAMVCVGFRFSLKVQKSHGSDAGLDQSPIYKQGCVFFLIVLCHVVYRGGWNGL